MTDAEWRGYCAYQNDVPRDQNPFVGSEAAEWDNGWDQAEGEVEIEAYAMGLGYGDE